MGDVGFGGEDGGEHEALSFGELGAECGGVEGRLALFGWHLAKVEDGTDHDLSTRGGKSAQLLHGGVPLLTLGRSHVLQGLVAFEHPGALLRSHAVEPGQLVTIVLLGLRGQLVKARQVLQCALLLGQWEITVVGHPLRNMFLILGGSGGGAIRHGTRSPGGRLG